MGYMSAGSVGIVPRNEWDPHVDYKKLDVVRHNNKVYMARKSSLGVEPEGTTTAYWMILFESYSEDMKGASADKKGVHGLVPEPLAGDEDKVLSGDGNWKHKLETDIIKVDGKIGYVSNNKFIPFFTYEDAINECLIGNAEPDNVLTGKSFTNHTARGLAGTMKDFSNSRLVVTADTSDQNSPSIRKTTVNNNNYYEVSMPTGYWTHTLGSSSALIPAEEKTVTAPTSTINVEPTAGKVLSKVIVYGTPTQEKTVTASRSQQIVTPDSGKQLSKVTVNKFPDANGTFKPTVISRAVDMGSDNNYRYVDVTGVVNLNAVSVLSNARSEKTICENVIRVGTVYFGETRTFNIGDYLRKHKSDFNKVNAHIPDYRTITINHFFVDKGTASYTFFRSTECKLHWVGSNNTVYDVSATGKIERVGDEASLYPKLSYNSSTGILTVTGYRKTTSFKITSSLQPHGNPSTSTLINVDEIFSIDIYMILS